MPDGSIMTTPRVAGTRDLTERLKESSLDSAVDHDQDPDRDSTMEGIKEDPACDPLLDRPPPDPSYYYGVLSDKIGEAVACWLTRWGVDLLRYELEVCSEDKVESGLPNYPLNQWTRRRATTICGAGPTLNVDCQLLPHSVPIIWRKGGLSARWIRGVLSSDVLFVSGEKERYDMTRAAVELRRVHSVREGDEKEFDTLFRQGIHYANMVCNLSAIPDRLAHLTRH